MRALRAQGYEIAIELSGTFRLVKRPTCSRPGPNLTLPAPVLLEFWQLQSTPDGGLRIETGAAFEGIPWDSPSRELRRRTTDVFEPVIFSRKRAYNPLEIVRRGHVVLVGTRQMVFPSDP